MPLLLVRHAHAVSEEENRKRPLSERGRTQAGELALLLRKNHLFPAIHVWHSPLARARETAEIIVKTTESDAALVETPGLLPEDDPLEIIQRIEASAHSPQPLAIVGHQPHLGALATLLVRGKTGREIVDFKKAAALSLSTSGKEHRKTGRLLWTIDWFVTPGLFCSSPATAKD